MKRKKRLVLSIIIILGILMSITALFYGRFDMDVNEVFRVMTDEAYRESAKSSKVVLFNIRLPRILTALFVGGAFSISGAAYQSTFMNPMVSPNLLGVTSGAGFGASLGILLGFSTAGIQTMAFLFGIGTMALTYGISYAVGSKYSNMIITIILAGMVVSSLFNSFISITKFLADPNDTLPEITFWLMGSISGVTMNDFYKVGIPIVIGVIPLMVLRWKMNLLALGEDDARAIGLNTRLVRLVIILSSTMIVSASVSVCGIIGWIGIVIPHIARMLVGYDNQYLIPTSLVLGGIYLLFIDTIARTILPIEIPLSILTSIVGAPFFVYLMFKRKGVWT